MLLLVKKFQKRLGKKKYIKLHPRGKRLFTLAGMFCFFAIATSAKDMQYGAKLSLGMSYLNSANLQEYFDYKRINSSSINPYDLQSEWGLGYQIGGILSYPFTDRINLTGEMAFHRIKTTLKIEQEQKQEQETRTIHSENMFSINSFNIPVLLRYHITDMFFANGGAAFDFILQNKLDASEKIVNKEFENGNLQSRNTEYNRLTVKMDKFSSLRAALVVGGGMKFNISGQNIRINLRYHIPATQSIMYTTNDDLEDNTKVSDVFSEDKYEDINDIDNFDKRLDDYSLGFLSLNLSCFF